MRPYFFNSAIVKAPSWFLHGRLGPTIRLKVRFGIVVHPEEGPIVIDTGYASNMGHTNFQPGIAYQLYRFLLRPDSKNHMQPAEALAQLGYNIEDVKWVIATHFHADHIAGLRLFKHANFIASKAAFDELTQMTEFGRLRNGVFLEMLPQDFEERLIPVESFTNVNAPFSLGDGKDLFGDGRMLAIDLPGHAIGHFGIQFLTEACRLFYAVDSQFMKTQTDTPLLAGPLAKSVARDRSGLKKTTKVLNSFVSAGGELLLCHDPETSIYDWGK